MNRSVKSVEEKRESFKELHRKGCFVIPNPWDIGSARYLESLNFKAIATTSSGVAWSAGRPDQRSDVRGVVAHIAALVDAVDLPVNADFEDGFAEDLDELAANIRHACNTGIAGLSIEDKRTIPDRMIRDLSESVARIHAARAAIDAEGGNVVLVGRAEGFISGRPDLDDVLKRLAAFADAGADCLYAPGLTTDEQVAAVVRAVSPKPVNVLVGQPGFTVARLEALGVRRISVGGAMARAAWGGFMTIAREIADNGTFDSFRYAASGSDLNRLMSAN